MKKMKIRIENEAHYNSVSTTLRHMGHKLSYQMPTDLHSIFLSYGFVGYVSDGIDTEHYFRKHELPEYKLETKICNDEVISKFVKVDVKKKWKFVIDDQLNLIIADVVTGKRVALVIAHSVYFGDVNKIMEKKGYDTSGLTFDECGRIIMKLKVANK